MSVVRSVASVTFLLALAASGASSLAGCSSVAGDPSKDSKQAIEGAGGCLPIDGEDFGFLDTAERNVDAHVFHALVEANGDDEAAKFSSESGPTDSGPERLYASQIEEALRRVPDTVNGIAAKRAHAMMRTFHPVRFLTVEATRDATEVTITWSGFSEDCAARPEVRGRYVVSATEYDRQVGGRTVELAPRSFSLASADGTFRVSDADVPGMFLGSPRGGANGVVGVDAAAAVGAFGVATVYGSIAAHVAWVNGLVRGTVPDPETAPASVAPSLTIASGSNKVGEGEGESPVEPDEPLRYLVYPKTRFPYPWEQPASPTSREGRCGQTAVANTLLFLGSTPPSATGDRILDDDVNAELKALRTRNPKSVIQAKDDLCVGDVVGSFPTTVSTCVSTSGVTRDVDNAKVTWDAEGNNYYGLESRRYRKAREDIERAVRIAPIPVLLNVTNPGESKTLHWMLAIGTNSRGIYLVHGHGDSYRWYPWNEFARRWEDNLVPTWPRLQRVHPRGYVALRGWEAFVEKSCGDAGKDNGFSKSAFQADRACPNGNRSLPSVKEHDDAGGSGTCCEVP